MSRLLFFSMLIYTLILASGAGYPRPLDHVAGHDHASAAVTAPAAAGADPLPGGCIRVIPPGGEEPICCISGFVYIDGQVVAGAEVKIETEAGDAMTLTTQQYSGGEPRPYYRASLSSAPLSVRVGERILIRASYSSHVRTISYEVQAGGQQVDIVLPRNQRDDVVFERQIWGQADPDKLNGPRGIAVGKDGRIYVVDAINARVQVFSSTGQFLRQWGTRGSVPGQFISPEGIAVDASMNVYVADTGNHRIQKFNSSGDFLASWGGFGSAVGQFDRPRSVAVDRLGSIFIADAGNDRIQKLASDGTRLLGWSRWGDTEEFESPQEVAVDGSGRVYVLSGSRVHKFSNTGQYISSVGGDPFSSLSAIAVNAKGDLYIYDDAEGQVRGPGAHFGEPGQGDGQFKEAEAITLDDNGNIYVADTGNQRIQQFTGAGVWVRSWGDRGDADGRISEPSDIALGRNGLIYVTDQETDRVQTFNRTGLWLDSWGDTGDGPGQFNYPSGVAVAPDGTVYVVDVLNNNVQHFSAEGQLVHRWGGEGQANGAFSRPTDIAVDSAGQIYVADSENNRIQKFRGDGVWLQSWFSPSAESVAIDAHDWIYVGEGSAVAVYTQNGQLQRRWGRQSDDQLSVDANGNIFSVDQWNDRIDKLGGDGTLLSSWGVFGHGAGQFSSPSAIAASEDGTVFVGDSGNNRVQIFQPMTFTRPIATISHLSATTLDLGTPLVARGQGQDSDETGTIAAYRWLLDGAQEIGNAATLNLPTDGLTPGTHTLSFSVRDTEGIWSDSISASFYVAARADVQWTMLLYLVGDYDDRESQLTAFTRTLQALEQSFRNPFVRIAVQIDGPADGDTQRLLIRPGTAASPPEVILLPYGERAMDDPETLANFLRWGQSTFPAEHYYLAIADHGQAIQGIGWDSTSDRRDGVADDNAYLTAQEVGQALRAPNVAPIDLLHLDACSMSLLEVAYEVQGRTQIVIASQYLAWSYFAYDAYASTMGASTTPKAVAEGILAQYRLHAQADQYPYTIAALDMKRAEATLTAVDQLAIELAALVNNDANNRTLLYSIWQASQKFESNGDFENNDLDLYVDLVDWTDRIQRQMSSPAVQLRAARLLTELTGPQPFIIASRAQSNTLPPQYGAGHYIDLTRAHGVSIFYPRQRNSVVFDDYINDRLFSFTSSSHWPNFLIAGTGPLTPGPLEPPPGPLGPLSPTQRMVFLPLAQR